ncbi:MAG: hypothetical protein WBL43_20225, partial [Pseudolabrys sp.]
MSHSKKASHCATGGSCKFNLRLTAIRKAPASALDKTVRSSDPAATLVIERHNGGVPFVKP